MSPAQVAGLPLRPCGSDRPLQEGGGGGAGGPRHTGSECRLVCTGGQEEQEQEQEPGAGALSPR